MGEAGDLADEWGNHQGQKKRQNPTFCDKANKNQKNNPPATLLTSPHTDMEWSNAVGKTTQTEKAGTTEKRR